MKIPPFWLILGFVGQALFSMRFILQWVQSEREGRSVVYLAGRRPRPREVVLGPSNADFVVVEKGLARGERVLLRDPETALPDFSGAPGS